jgi:hypothetical protein
MAIRREVPIEGPAAIAVYATSEDIKKYIRHPFGVRQFDRDGKAVWPDDQFTQRRIRDGDVTLEPPKKTAPHPTHGKTESKT